MFVFSFGKDFNNEEYPRIFRYVSATALLGCPTFTLFRELLVSYDLQGANQPAHYPIFTKFGVFRAR